MQTRPTINGKPVSFIRHCILGGIVRLLAKASNAHPALNPYAHACGWLSEPCREDNENYGPLARMVKKATRRIYEASVDRRRGYFDED